MSRVHPLDAATWCHTERMYVVKVALNRQVMNTQLHRMRSCAGSMKTTAAEKKLLATQSLENSCKSPAFVRIYPEYQEKLKEQRRYRKDNGFVEPSEKDTEEAAETAAENAEVAAVAAPGVQGFAQIAATVGAVAVALGVVYVQYTLSSR